MASVAISTNSSGITSFPAGRFLLRVEGRLRFLLPGRPKARECLSIRALWRALGQNSSPNFAVLYPRQFDYGIAPKLASEPDVNVKFSQVRISGSSPEVRLSRYLRSVWSRRVILSSAPRRNHTSETSHLAGPNRDVGPADRCESVAAVLRKSAFSGASSVTRLKDLSVPRDGSPTKATTKSSSSGDGMSARR